MELSSYSIQECHKKLAAGEMSSRELVSAYLRTIEEKNTEIHAFLEVFEDALEQADAADKRRAAGEDNPLLGVPVAVKDNILIYGRTASAGSKMLENYTASYDAAVIRKLKDAGAVFVGRTNMDEFAMGSSTEHAAFGPTRNPVSPEHVPGGSSGGSAAAVAMNGVPLALGSDTGGSIRQPASFCGVVGLKPTYGSVSRSGLMAMGSSLDVIGPLARTVSDAEVLFEHIAGPDPKDATSIAEDTYPEVSKECKRIGVPRTFLEEHLTQEAASVFENAYKTLEEKGYEIVDIELPRASDVLSTYYVLMCAESSTNLARFDGVRYGLHVSGENVNEDFEKTRATGFGPEVRRRIMLGTYVLSSGYFDAYYARAGVLRQRVTDALKKAYENVDVIAMPTTPAPAFRLGEKADPLSLYLTDVFTVPANLSGMPALSVPAGATAEGLPMGLQFVGPHNSEPRLFAVGKDLTGETMA